MNFSDFALDPETNDIYFDSTGNWALVTNKELAYQNIKIAILTQLGEYGFDTTLGIDYKKLISEKLDIVFLSNQLRDNLLRLSYVTDVELIIESIQKRVATFTVRCTTTWGDVNVAVIG